MENIVEINLTDSANFVSEERAGLLAILKAMDKGFDASDSMGMSLMELASDAKSYLYDMAWEPELFAKCSVKNVNIRNETASFKWNDGFGGTPEGIAYEYFRDFRAYEVEPGEWIYVNKGDERFEKAHRLVARYIDSVGRMVQLYC